MDLWLKKYFVSNPPLPTYIIGGTIGGILHITLDSFYHSDVRPFYPFSNTNFAYLGIAKEIVLLCLIGYLAFFIALAVRFYLKKVRNDA
jgi:membrane-bound metal-dependent hydrolase YbcI (DUF457 family)